MRSLEHAKCVKVPPSQLCGGMAINGYSYECVGFCSLVALLMAMKFLNGDRNRSSKWLCVKKMREIYI